MIELQKDIDKILSKIVQEYKDNKRLILTESDLVNIVYSRIATSGIRDNHSVLIHSELRPIKGVEAIRDEKWQPVKPINYAKKVDLVLIDSAKKHWKEAYEYVKSYQTKDGEKGSDLRYWRFLAYPVDAFKAVLEFKIRVNGNSSGIKKDIKKLSLIRCKKPDCLTYLVILDRKGRPSLMNKIIDESNTKNLRLYSNIKCKENRCK